MFAESQTIFADSMFGKHAAMVFIAAKIHAAHCFLMEHPTHFQNVANNYAGAAA